MTFPEAKTTGSPVKNLNNAAKNPLPPATGGGGFLGSRARNAKAAKSVGLASL